MKRLLRAAWTLAGVLAILALTSVCLAREGGAGAIRGSVYDLDFEVPLAEVRVSIAGVSAATTTGTDGNFVFPEVPPGTYTMLFIKDGFQRRVVPNVIVNAGRLTSLRAELASEVVEMEELVIAGVDLLASSEIGSLEIRSEATAVQDAISSELIGKAGVSDAAGALKLVVGASVVGGKYAAVRGLSDRYTGTTLNGLRIPSADPRRRAVQLDLFPTGTIESLTVTKTFTPDLQGDFTGGGVDIRTRSIPEERFMSASVSVEHNSLATGNSGNLTYAGGGVDTWGFDSGARGLPDEALRDLPSIPRFSSAPTASDTQASRAYDEFTRSFAPTMGVSRGSAEPNHGFSLSAGTRLGADDGPVFGVIGALTYSHKHDFYQDGENNNATVSVAGQPITPERQRSDTRSTDEVLIGGLASFVYQPEKDHELSLKLILNQSAEDEARLQVQETGNRSVEQNQSLVYTERVVGSAQLHGTHLLGSRGDLALNWVAAWNFTRQDEPDVRFFRNTFDLDSLSARMPSNSTDAQNTRRIFRDIGENNIEGGLDVTLPFTQWTQSAGTLKAGLYTETTDRSYDQRSFTYTFPTQFGSFRNPAVASNLGRSQFAAGDEDDLWTDVFNNARRLGMADNTPPAPNQLLWVITPLGDDVDYTGDQTIQAAYGMLDLPLHPKVKLIGGARFESTEISIEPDNQAFGNVEVIEVLPMSGDRAIVEVPQEDAAASIEQRSILPSLSLVYEIASNMNLRASWSRTIARPTFRELAPVATEEFIFGDEFIGNPALSLSSITNYDLRWEWFPGSGDVLAASVFSKDIRDPIEMISFSAGGRSFVQPLNFEKGRVAGVEAEARATLQRLWPPLKGISAGVNATYIHSEVAVPEAEQTSLADFGLDQSRRRLQGQPEYLFNVNINYDHERLGTSASLFYNLIGETLLTGAARGVQDGNPSVFEKPFGTLDLTASQKIFERLSVTFRARNVLGNDRRTVYRTPDGEEAVKTLRGTAVLYSLSMSVAW